MPLTTTSSERIGVGQGRAGCSPGSAGRKHKGAPYPRRTPSPLPQGLDDMGRAGRGVALSALFNPVPMECPPQAFDASKSLTALEQDSTLIAVIEMSQSKWLVAAVVPGVERRPLKKFDAHEETLLKLLHRWRSEAGQAGRNIKRVVVAFESGRDG